MILISLSTSAGQNYTGVPFFKEVPEIIEEIDVIEYLLLTGSLDLSLKYNPEGSSNLDQFLQLHRLQLYGFGIYNYDLLWAGRQYGKINVSRKNGEVSTTFYSYWQTYLDNDVSESYSPIEKTGLTAFEDAITEFIEDHFPSTYNITFPDSDEWRRVRPVEAFLLEVAGEIGEEIYIFDFAGMSVADALRQICFWGNCGVLYDWDAGIKFVLKDRDDTEILTGVITDEQRDVVNYDPVSDKISVSVYVTANLLWTPFDEKIEDYIQNYGGYIKKYDVESKEDHNVGDRVQIEGITGIIIKKRYFVDNIEQKYYTIADLSGVYNFSDADEGSQSFSFTQGPSPANTVSYLYWDQVVEENVKIYIEDAGGTIIETLMDRTIKPGSYKLIHNVSGYASGVYSYYYESVSNSTNISVGIEH